MNQKLHNAISKVAELWPDDGILLADTDPVEFMNRIYEEIVNLRADARILAHAYKTDNRPPAAVVKRSLAYPVFPTRR